MPITDGGSWQRRLWILMLVLLPFGEGSAMPGSLLLIHSLLLLLCGMCVARRSWPLGDTLPAELRLPATMFLVLLLVTSMGSPYPYASFLRSWDLVVLLLAFAAARETDWGAGRERLLFDALLFSAGLRALGVPATALSRRASA